MTSESKSVLEVLIERRDTECILKKIHDVLAKPIDCCKCEHSCRNNEKVIIAENLLAANKKGDLI